MWLQYGAWLYKINITTNKWLYYVIVFVIMAVFALISSILVAYVNYAINRGEHPRLNTFKWQDTKINHRIITRAE